MVAHHHPTTAEIADFYSNGWEEISEAFSVLVRLRRQKEYGERLSKFIHRALGIPRHVGWEGDLQPENCGAGRGRWGRSNWESLFLS